MHEKFNGTSDDVDGQAIASKASDKIAELAKAKQEEEAKKAAEEQKSAQDKAREIIRVKRVKTGTPNSANGVDLYIYWSNQSEKAIKYAYFQVVPYNKVNDAVASEIGGESLFTGKETGPFAKGEGNNGNSYWESAWYNNTIVRAELQEIDIEYMDGTTATVKGDDLKYVQY